MDTKILDFLSRENIAVVAIALPDGAPYAATVHFSHATEPLRFFIQTPDNTRKAQALIGRSDIPASMVIGFNEHEMLTVQMTGTINIVTEPEKQEVAFAIHHAKHERAAKFRGPHSVILEFIPSWWRYSELKTNTIIESK